VGIVSNPRRVVPGRESGKTLTSSKRETRNPDADQPTTSDVDTLGDDGCVHVGPGETCSDLDCLRVLIDDNDVKARQGDVYAEGRREPAIDRVPSALDCEWCARRGEFVKLRRSRRVTSTRRQG